MAATFSLERVRHHLLPAVACLVGLGVAVGIATVPSAVLNAAVDRGGLDSILPAAASPIGTTGRTLLALFAGALIAACGFVAPFKAALIARIGGAARAPRMARVSAPSVRRADAHPDAPPRRPIRAASDLGDPLPIFGPEDHAPASPPSAERSLPDDLDRPLAEFDPAAVPLHPMAPPTPVAPLARRAEPAVPASDPGARFAWLAPEEPEETAPAPGGAPATESASPDTSPSMPMPHRAGPGPLPPVVTTPECEASPVPAAVAPQPLVAVATTPATRSPQPAPAQPVAPTLREADTPRLIVSPGDEGVAAIAASCDPGREDDTIAGLLARLERGAAQRRIVATPIAPATRPCEPAPAPPAAVPPAAEPASLDETLQRLRRLAAG